VQLTNDVFGAAVGRRGESHEVPEELRWLAASRGGRILDLVGASLLWSWSGNCADSSALFFLARLFSGL